MNGREAPATETLTAAEVQSRWDQVLGAVQAGRKRVLVEQDGVPVAAIVSIDDWKQLQRLDQERKEGMDVLERSWAVFKDVDPATIESEVAAAVAAARADLRREATGTG